MSKTRPSNTMRQAKAAARAAWKARTEAILGEGSHLEANALNREAHILTKTARGVRYGNQRKMRAKLKVRLRKDKRRLNNQIEQE